jgi:hypothetical protein
VPPVVELELLVVDDAPPLPELLLELVLVLVLPVPPPAPEPVTVAPTVIEPLPVVDVEPLPVP